MTEDEKREYQVLHLAAGSLLPILEQRLTLAKNKLLSAYRAGKSGQDLNGPVAKFAEAHDVIQDIKRKIETYEALAEHEQKGN